MDEIKKRINDNWTSYHIPGCGVIHRIKRNVIFINSNNSFKHEIAKALACIMLNKYGIVEFGNYILNDLDMLAKTVKNKMVTYVKSKAEFITECVPNQSPNRRIDLVNLNTGERFEFEVSRKVKRDNCTTIYI